MRAGGSVATLASIVLPAALLVEIDSLVRILLKSVRDIFVTGLTGLRPDIGFWARRGSRSFRLSGSRFRLLCRRFGRFLLLISGSQTGEYSNYRCDRNANTAHATCPRRTWRSG